jgi:hypothetical protein
MISFMTRPIYPREKSPRYLLDGRLGRDQSRSGSNGEEKNPCPCRESNPGFPTLRLAIMLPELLQLPQLVIPKEIAERSI